MERLSIKDLNQMGETELKALCYDELKELELHGKNLKIIENILLNKKPLNKGVET